MRASGSVVGKGKRKEFGEEGAILPSLVFNACIA